MGFSSVFGGTAIVSANPSYSALTLAATTTLAWPLETVEGNPYVAAQMDVTATSAALILLMPSALQASTGIISVITNVGPNTFTLADNTGISITTILSGQAIVLTLTANSSQGGMWRVTALGATTSTISAANIAGNGLQAQSGQLQTNWPTTIKTSNYVILSADRGSVIEWNGTGGTFTLDVAVNLGVGFICGVINRGTGNLILQGSSSQLINGNLSLIMIPGASVIVVAANGEFNALGIQPTPVPISGGGTGATTAASALTSLGVSSIGASIVTSPNAAAVAALIGFSTGTPAFNTITASTAQAITALYAYNIMVCTATLTATLPLSSTQTSTFAMFIYAQGGEVTITPNVADAFANMSVNTSFVIGKGGICLLTTKATGTWFPLLIAPGVRAPTSAATITLTPYDRIVNIATSSTAVTVNVPTTGGPFTVIDLSMNAQVNNITITPSSGTINGASTLVMRSNGASTTFSPVGSNWSIS